MCSGRRKQSPVRPRVAPTVGNMSSINVSEPLAVPVFRSLLLNGNVCRAIALPIAAIALISMHHPTWVPFAVSAYGIWNAAALTRDAARAASAAR